jgi:hypothetical protein
MAPHSSNVICDSERTVNDSISRNNDEVEKKPTNLVEVVSHFPKDVFEKRPFRAYMGALQVCTKREYFSRLNVNSVILR